MKRAITLCFVLLLTQCFLTSQTQDKAPARPGTNQPSSTSFVDRVLKFLGFGDSAGMLKGPDDELASGDLWLADLRSGTTRGLTTGGTYRSPVFLPGTNDALALRGNDVMQVPIGGGEGKKLYSVASILKLVGAGVDAPGKVLILLQSEACSHPQVAVLTVSSGSVTPLPYDPASAQQLRMVEALQGWSRSYGDQHIFVDEQTKQALSGTVQWTDVFRQVGNAPPVDVSRCDGTNCGQPSLSEDGRLLVFVKVGSE